jgi:hypothetical protein
MEKAIRNMVWTRRFISAAIVQGTIIVGLTIFLILGQISLIKPDISRVIAAGGVGTWFTFGFILYIVVGVIGIAVSALFYLYIERIIGKQYKEHSVATVAAWIHLIFMNMGTTASMSMLMFAGYIGGAAMLPISVGGRALNPGQVHELIGSFVEPIAVAILVLLFGVICGGLGFLLVHRQNSIITKNN